MKSGTSEIWPLREETLSWLLEGDISIQYQVNRDLVGKVRKDLQERISSEGWGAEFLSHRRRNGHWGRGFYQTKWISTHYTLLDLRNLCITSDQPQITQSIKMILKNEKGPDGGINPSKTIGISDVCVSGMFLNYASYFRAVETDLESVIDHILSQQMKDGGFNCQFNRFGAVHSSLHSTISVAEGILEYAKNGYRYRVEELREVESDCQEFILQHRLFKSDKTGEIIDKRMLMLSWPSRWKFDILRALDYLRVAGMPYDERMEDALKVVSQKKRKDGRWPLQAKHPGRTHFDMEPVGKPSRWNTLRALRVLRHFKSE